MNERVEGGQELNMESSLQHRLDSDSQPKAISNFPSLCFFLFLSLFAVVGWLVGLVCAMLCCVLFSEWIC